MKKVLTFVAYAALSFGIITSTTSCDSSTKGSVTEKHKADSLYKKLKSDLTEVTKRLNDVKIPVIDDLADQEEMEAGDDTLNTKIAKLDSTIQSLKQKSVIVVKNPSASKKVARLDDSARTAILVKYHAAIDTFKTVDPNGYKIYADAQNKGKEEVLAVLKVNDLSGAHPAMRRFQNEVNELRLEDFNKKTFCLSQNLVSN